MLTTTRAGRTYAPEASSAYRITDYAVTTLDFADIAEAIAGSYTPSNNARLVRSKLETVASIADDPMREVCRRVWDKSRNRFGWKPCNTVRKWYGGINNADDARALLDKGWPDGAARAAELTPALRDIVPPPREIRRRVRWMDNGGELHIDRAMSGDWDTAWRNTGPHPQTPRIISLGCSYGGPVQVTHEELFWNAAQMLVACDVLEQAGYSVELRALAHNVLPHQDDETRARKSGTRCDCPGYLTDITVKRAGQPLRADAVAAVFGHAGVYRTYGHILITTAPFAVDDLLGRAQPLAPIVSDATAAGIIPPVDFLLESSTTRDEAVTQITRVLTKVEQNA